MRMMSSKGAPLSRLTLSCYGKLYVTPLRVSALALWKRPRNRTQRIFHASRQADLWPR
jgi:hypothetical protein